MFASLPHMCSAVADIAKDLGKEVAGRVHIMVCNMASLAAVDALAQQFIDTGKPLHVLALNAGEVNYCSFENHLRQSFKERRGKDGFPLQFDYIRTSSWSDCWVSYTSA